MQLNRKIKTRRIDTTDTIIDLLIERGARPKGAILRKLIIWQITIGMTYFVKRLADIIITLAALTILSPLLILVAIIIKLDSNGPVVFRQTRVGKNGRHFTFLKFRSMKVNAENLRPQLEENNESADGVIFKIKHDPRITRVGRFLRKFSIDELPQLFNVLTGDMSLVGPPPPRPPPVAH